MMDRRGFLKNATLVSAACLMDFREALAWGAKDADCLLYTSDAADE